MLFQQQMAKTPQFTRRMVGLDEERLVQRPLRPGIDDQNKRPPPTAILFYLALPER